MSHFLVDPEIYFYLWSFHKKTCLLKGSSVALIARSDDFVSGSSEVPGGLYLLPSCEHVHLRDLLFHEKKAPSDDPESYLL